MRRGATLIETVVAIAVFSILAGLFVTLVTNMLAAQKFTSEAPSVQIEATDRATGAAALVRRAPLCLAASGCAGVIDSALATASSSSLTVYTSQAGATTTLTGGNGVTLSYQYLLNAIRSYSYPGDVSGVAWVTTPTAAELPTVQGLRVTATVTRSGLTASSRAEVRLRNSPRRLRSTD